MRKILLTLLSVLILMFSFASVAMAEELNDGVYEVNILLWHSEDDKASMAADAIGSKATIVVQNGKKKMYITSGEMSMMGIVASLQELKVADSNGNYTDAVIEEKNEEGNPTVFSFVLPHDQEYIVVKVNPHIALMGNKDIGARIKVDYSSLKLVKEFEKPTEPQTTVVEVTNAKGETVTEVVTVENTEQQTDYLINYNDIAPLVTETATISSTTDASSENDMSFVIVILAIVTVAVGIHCSHFKENE